MSKRYNRKLPSEWTVRAQVFTALGDEYRQRMLLMFECDEELTIKDIAVACTLSRTAVAHHLRVLRDAGVLKAEKRGQSVYLRPNPKIVIDAIEGLLDYIQQELLTKKP
jgi:DNA-binding transcriptional ArsR family regulator